MRRSRGLRVVLVALGLAIVAAATVTSAADKKASPAVGEVAPEVTLPDQHGKSFVLAESLKEREFVVLAFYPKAFTTG